MNEVLLSGNIGKDPEFKSTKNGKDVAVFGLAVSEKKPDGNFDTIWFDIEAWGWLADRVREHGGKGVRTLVKGKLTQDQWVGADGKKRTKIKVVAFDLFFEPRREINQYDNPEPSISVSRREDNFGNTTEPNVGEIPF